MSVFHNRCQYVNLFRIPAINKAGEQFQFHKCFTSTLNLIPEWKLDYKDFFFGFIPYSQIHDDHRDKVVLRIKGQGLTSDYYQFSLESANIMDSFTTDYKLSSLEPLLKEAHDRIEDFFIDILTPDYREELELKVDILK